MSAPVTRRRPQGGPPPIAPALAYGALLIASVAVWIGGPQPGTSAASTLSYAQAHTGQMHAQAVLVFGALQLFLSRTRLGWMMRATAEDADAAELVGINSRGTYAWATALAVGIAALGGLFLGIRSVFDPVSGPTQLIFAFEAVVIGGMGSLWGTLVGGIALGVAQTLGAQVNPEFAVISGHLLFLVVLIARFGGGRTVLRVAR